VMSFTVARASREIGIRVALGAGRRRVLAAIFRLPVIQMTVGVAVGYVLLCVLSSAGEEGPIQWKMFATFIPYAVFMFGVCLLACIVPTLRALRVQPTEALRAEV
jgi:putative ABC transport system permease protein